MYYAVMPKRGKDRRGESMESQATSGAMGPSVFAFLASWSFSCLATSFTRSSTEQGKDGECLLTSRMAELGTVTTGSHARAHIH